MNEKKVIQLLKELWQSLQRAVPSSSNAQTFLKERNFNYKNIEVGFLGKNYANMQTLPGRSVLEEMGILISFRTNMQSSPLKNTVIFPLKDIDGNITGLYGRKTDDENNKHVFINEKSGVYPAYPKAETEKLILTTSITDAVSLLHLPFIKEDYSVMAIHGFEGINEKHKEAIQRLEYLKHVVIISPDAFKQTELKENIEKLNSKAEIHIAELPIGEDINTLYTGDQEDTLKTLIQIKETDTKISSVLQVEKPETIIADAKEEFITDNFKDIIYKTANHTIHVQGGIPDSFASMKVQLAIYTGENQNKIFRNKIDLFSFDEVKKESEKAVTFIGGRADLVSSDLHKLSSLLEEFRKKNENKKQGHEELRPVLPKATVEACKKFLSEKDLFKRINEEIEQSGIVGEENSRMLVFAIATSYRMPNGLHGILIGDSTSGKTTMMNFIGEDLIPKEDRKSFTRITEGSLFNIDSDELNNKLILIEDRIGIEDRAKYALRELQTKGEIISLTTSKNEAGEYGTTYNRVKAKVASLSCSTSGEFLNDDENRCFIIKVDQSNEQTQKIIEYQKKFYAGKIDKEKQEKTKEFIQNCVRILHGYEVINPFAEKLTIPQKARNQRRLNQLFLSLINQVTLLHQYGRKKDSKGRLIATLEDIEIAIEIMFDAIVLKTDLLEDGILRDFYEKLKSYVKTKNNESYQFTCKELREEFNIGKSKVNGHLQSLVSHEFIQIVGGSPYKGLKYQVSVWDDSEKVSKELKKTMLDQVRQLK